MNAANENARRLAGDAEILLNAGAFPSAASLATLAIEEAGKASILRQLAVANSPGEIAAAWRDYRSHTRKNAAWIMPQLVAKGARQLEDFRPLFDEMSDHPFVLDQIKQLGFYTDCLGNTNWSTPADVVDEQLARRLVKISQLMAGHSNHTEREIELWIEHIGPVWKKDMSWMKRGLINWYSAMQAEGLALEGHNRMATFVQDGTEV